MSLELSELLKTCFKRAARIAKHTLVHDSLEGEHVRAIGLIEEGDLLESVIDTLLGSENHEKLQLEWQSMLTSFDGGPGFSRRQERACLILSVFAKHSPRMN